VGKGQAWSALATSLTAGLGTPAVKAAAAAAELRRLGGLLGQRNGQWLPVGEYCGGIAAAVFKLGGEPAVASDAVVGNVAVASDGNGLAAIVAAAVAIAVAVFAAGFAVSASLPVTVVGGGGV
jgi:hypothetical protein